MISPTSGTEKKTGTVRPTFPTVVALMTHLQGVSPVKVASVVLVAAFLIRLAMNLSVGSRFPYSTYYIAVVLCSIHSGARTGALVALVGFFLGNYFVGDANILPTAFHDVMGGLLYFLNCAIVILFTEVQRSTYATLLVHASALEVETEERRHAESALRQAENRYRILSELTSDFAFGCRIRSDGKVLVEWISDAYTRVTGWTKEELNEGGISRTLYSDDLMVARRLLAEMLAGNAADAEYRVFCKDGRVLWLHTYVRPLDRDPDGTVVQFIGAAQDITPRRLEQEQTEATLRRLNLILEGAGLGAWEFDPGRESFWTDKRGKAIHGMTGREFTSIEEAIENIITEEQTYLGPSFDEALVTGEDYRSEYPVRWPDGSRHWVLCYGRRVELPDGPRMYGIVQDIQDRKLAQQEREQVLQEIESLNARLRRAVQETHHRVKNNLQVIAALAEMEALTTHEVPISVLHRIGQHARMLALIHDLLTQQSRELGNADDRIPIGRVMERLLPLVQSTIGERIVHSESDTFEITAREGGAIALLINELVSNAVKHGGSEIGIAAIRADNDAVLTVWDDGPGFPADFDPLRAAHTGLELVESAARWDLQGDVRFENRVTGGAQVIVTFPLSREEAISK
jgi:PAS domain S-box-containing protein